MTKILSRQTTAPMAALAACAFACTTPIAHATTVTIRVDQAAINALTAQTYGAGIDYHNADIRVMFTDQPGDKSLPPIPAQKTYDMLNARNQDSLHLGMYRFPGGDPSFVYRWDKPCGSVDGKLNDDNAQCHEWLSPADIEKYLITAPSGQSTTTAPRAPLGASAMYQINTVQSWLPRLRSNPLYKADDEYAQFDYSTVYMRDANGLPLKVNGAYKIDEIGLNQAAQVAAQWVTENNKNLATRVEYWEIGNEDWVRWSPSDYATIFARIANAMIKANGSNAPLKLIAQTSPLVFDYTSTKPTNLGINQTAGSTFASKFAAQLTTLKFKLSNVYGLALHPYLSSKPSSDINVRMAGLFTDINATDTSSQLQTTLKDMSKINGGKWKLLVTEYNIDQEGIYPAQNKAHAVTLADWSANMLSRGVEKIMPHSLESSPRTALMLYRNGGTLEQPLRTPTGTAFSGLAADFVGTMYKAENDSTTTSGGYASLGSYAVMRTDTAGKKYMQVLLVNRDLYADQVVSVNLKAHYATNFGATGQSMVTRTFGDTTTTPSTVNDTTTSPGVTPYAITWTTPTSTAISTSACTKYSIFTSYVRTCTLWDTNKSAAATVRIPKASMMRLTIPMTVN